MNSRSLSTISLGALSHAHSRGILGSSLNETYHINNAISELDISRDHSSGLKSVQQTGILALDDLRKSRLEGTPIELLGYEASTPCDPTGLQR